MNHGTGVRWWLLGPDAPSVVDRLRAEPGASTSATGFTAVANALELPTMTPVATADSRSDRKWRPNGDDELPQERWVLLARLTHASDADATSESALRTWLAKHCIPHQVLYPDSGSHLNPVLRAIGWRAHPARRLYNPWACESCSDPHCEHQLFTALLTERPRP